MADKNFLVKIKECYFYKERYLKISEINNNQFLIEIFSNYPRKNELSLKSYIESYENGIIIRSVNNLDYNLKLENYNLKIQKIVYNFRKLKRI